MGLFSQPGKYGGLHIATNPPDSFTGKGLRDSPPLEDRRYLAGYPRLDLRFFQVASTLGMMMNPLHVRCGCVGARR